MSLNTIIIGLGLATMAGVCIGWVLRAVFAPTPPKPELPFVRITPPLKTSVAPAGPGPWAAPKPAAPPKPLWEEDPFFAHPDDLGKPRDGDEIEHKIAAAAGNVVPLYATRSMG